MNSDHVPAIEILVEPEFLGNQSEPDKGQFVFSYHITIINHGDEDAQLISRHWLITDANEKLQEVRGMGVIGKQPVLKPGERYSYSSGAVINTPVGTMQGSYQMLTEGGREFEVPIPVFTLAKPGLIH